MMAKIEKWKSPLVLPEGITATPTALIIPKDASIRQWEELEETIGKVESCISWWIGDWWIFGHKFGDRIKLVPEGKYGAYHNAGWVASRFEFARRRANLPFSFHQDVAPLEIETQERLLDWAEKSKDGTGKDGKVTRRDLREKVRLIKTTPVIEDVDFESYEALLICGDSTKELKTLQSECIDLICTDPPYNINKADWDSYGSGVDFANWCEGWLRDCYRVLRPSGSIYLFGTNRMLSHIQHRMEEIGFHYRNWIIWDTIQGTGGGLWVNRHEGILYFSKTSETYEDEASIRLERYEENIREYKGREYKFKNPSNIWRIPCVDNKHKERTKHPTQKPVEIMERIIKANCPEGGMVLDPFMGSGTVPVACIKNRRRVIGIEISTEYIKIAKHRLKNTSL